MTRILVTGGAGYIGSHTCKLLAREGFEVAVVDNLSRGHRDFVKWGPLIEADIREPNEYDFSRLPHPGSPAEYRNSGDWWS